jgi:hypothetical protein
VGVKVGVGVRVKVAVAVDVRLGVAVGVLVETPVAGMLVFVRVATGGMVTTEVGLVVADGTKVRVAVGGNVCVTVLAGLEVLVGKMAPGVKKEFEFSQGGLVRMPGSRGSKKSSGLLVRKSLLGLRFDPMLAGNLQRGAKRSAQPLTRMMQMNPRMRISRIRKIESRRSFSRSRVAMETSIH